MVPMGPSVVVTDSVLPSLKRSNEVLTTSSDGWRSDFIKANHALPQSSIQWLTFFSASYARLMWNADFRLLETWILIITVSKLQAVCQAAIAKLCSQSSRKLMSCVHGSKSPPCLPSYVFRYLFARVHGGAIDYIQGLGAHH